VNLYAASSICKDGTSTTVNCLKTTLMLVYAQGKSEFEMGFDLWKFANLSFHY